MSRLEDIARFYALLSQLEKKLNGMITLGKCSGKMDWPERGVYFFFEMGETRSETGDGPRVVRVGTHALNKGSKSTLWGRLRQHRGTVSTGTGNHRSSIFRKLVGAALIKRSDLKDIESWGIGSSVSIPARQFKLSRDTIRSREKVVERQVSEYLQRMKFLCIGIDDAPGPNSLRGYIEKNTIALLSNFEKDPIDEQSSDWLGNYSNKEKVRISGLWNQEHVSDGHAPEFLDMLDNKINHF